MCDPLRLNARLNRTRRLSRRLDVKVFCYRLDCILWKLEVKKRNQCHGMECAWFLYDIENRERLAIQATSRIPYSPIILDHLCMSRKRHVSRSNSVRLLGISLLVDALQIMELMGGSESNLRARNVLPPPNQPNRIEHNDRRELS